MSQELDLLILNPFSPEFSYVPVGSFAICDFLNRQGFGARIVNLANHDVRSVFRRVDEALEEYSPRQIGLVLHWKETFNSFMSVGEHIHRRIHDVPLWAGGITAGYFAPELLRYASFLTGVIEGDAEVPLLELCQGLDPGDVPNLHWRTGDEVRSPQTLWTADGCFLDSLRYGRLEFLDDLATYLQRIDTRLGVPLAPGRGCAFDCGYCGGSRSAFRRHSHRSCLAMRAPEKVVDDIEDALSQGATQFLLSHFAASCQAILSSVRARFGSQLPFVLNLESWIAAPRDLVEQFAELVPSDRCSKRHLLITLRGSADRAKRTRERLEAARVADVAVAAAPDIQVTLFSSFFCPWQVNAASLDEDLRFSVEFSRDHLDKRARVALMALSTDPGSRWTTAQHGMKSCVDLPSIARGIFCEQSVVNNLLLHRPSELTEADFVGFLRSWHLDKWIREDRPLIWHLLTTILPFHQYNEILREASRSLYYVHDDRVLPISTGGVEHALAAIRAGLESSRPQDDGEVDGLRQFIMLCIAECVANKKPTPTVAEQEPQLPAFLSVDPDALLTLNLNFDSVLAKHHAGKPATWEDFQLVLQCRASCAYLLRPQVSLAQPPEEIALLEIFNGLTELGPAIRKLAAHLHAPEGAVTQRISDLWQSGILVSFLPSDGPSPSQ